MEFLISFFSEALLFLNGALGSVGLALIVFTIVIRLLVLPLTLPSIKSSQKIKKLQPELKKIKEKYKDDKQGYALAQSQLYKSYNINPLAGCLPQIIQLLVLIVLYRAIIRLFDQSTGLNFSFLWVDLSQPDSKYIFPVLAALSQFVLSLMISPATQTRDIVPNKTQSDLLKKANEKEEDIAEMASTMQQQMMFMMPIMTGVIALKLPSGLALYWIMGTLFSIVTQYFVSGLGGIAVFWNNQIAKKGYFGAKLLPEEQGKNLLLKEEKSEKIIKEPLLKKMLKKAEATEETKELAQLLAKKGGSTEALPKKNIRATKTKSQEKIKKNRQRKKRSKKKRS
ncbi:MAG: YidC/Oxa1 family membrane protein insertase [Patescibacteria group bacterium]